MAKELAEKTLSDGRTLGLMSYELDQASAEALSRPVGSSETVLVLREGGQDYACTEPSASWYLPMETLRKLYDAIKGSDAFEAVDSFLHKVRISRDASGVEQFLATL